MSDASSAETYAVIMGGAGKGRRRLTDARTSSASCHRTLGSLVEKYSYMLVLISYKYRLLLTCILTHGARQ